MIFYRCDNCREAFRFESEEDVPARFSRVEDGVAYYEQVCICPECGDYIYEVPSCVVCEERAADDETDVCPECTKKIVADFKKIVGKYNVLKKKDSDIEDAILGAICAQLNRNGENK